MKYLAKYIVLIIAVIFVQSTLAQDGDAVFNKIIREYTLNADGSTEYREYKEVKLLSHLSFHRLYGETFIVFDPGYQEIVINEAYTVMKDGKKVVVPDNAFNEVLPRAAAHAAPYNHLRELVITHTGLEIGATIYLDYTVRTRAGYMQTFMGEEEIKDIVPITEKKVIIRVPTDQELHYKVLNLRSSAEITEDQGMKVYTFNFRGLSAYTEEWGTDYESLPRLFFSTAKDLERAYFPFVAQEAFTFRVNEGMVSSVKKIMEENTDELRAALAIQKMVVNDIGTWNLPLEYAGFRCRTAVETWKSNGGTPLEKTVLLASLLRQAGYDAVPVAIIPQKYYDPSIGSLYMMEAFAVTVKTGNGERTFISATSLSSQDLAVSQQGKVFLVLDGAIESLKTYESRQVESSLIYTGDLELKGDVLSGTMNVKLSGTSNPYLSLYQDSSYAGRYAAGVKKTEIKQIEEDGSIAVLEVENKADFQEAGYIFLNIPESRYGIASRGFDYIEANRQSPINFGQAFTEEYSYKMTVQDKYSLISPAQNLLIDNDAASVLIEIRQQGSNVIVHRRFVLKTPMIRYDQFNAFSEAWDAWMNTSMKRLVFSIAE